MFQGVKSRTGFRDMLCTDDHTSLSEFSFAFCQYFARISGIFFLPYKVLLC